MSTRELKGLSKDICLHSKTRSGKIRRMSEPQERAATGTVEELSAQMERLREELQQRDRELDVHRTAAARASTELERVKKPLEDRVARLQQDLEQAELRGELAMFRALENARAEHQRALENEAERAKLWIEEIKKSHATERTQLLERVYSCVGKGQWACG